MSFMLACPHCGQKCRIGSHLAGKNVRCPKCTETFGVPSDSAESSPVAKTPPSETPSSETAPPREEPEPASLAPLSAPTAASGWASELAMSILVSPRRNNEPTPNPPMETPAEPSTAPFREEPIPAQVIDEPILASIGTDEEPPPPPSWRQPRGGRSRDTGPARRDRNAPARAKTPGPKSRAPLYWSLGFGSFILVLVGLALWFGLRPTPSTFSTLDANGRFRHEGFLSRNGFGRAEARFRFNLSADKVYVVQHQSRDFDAFLAIEDDRGRRIASDDDGGFNRDSLIRFRPPRTGEFVVVASPLGGHGGGRFTVLVDEDRNGNLAGNNPPLGMPPVGVRTERLALDANGRAEANSTLNGADGMEPNGNRRCRIYEIRLENNKEYQIDLMSRQFDSFLQVKNEANMILASDDDSGGNLDSRIRFRPPLTANYRLFVGPLGGFQGGDFSLRVQDTGAKIVGNVPVGKVPPGPGGIRREKLLLDANGRGEVRAALDFADGTQPNRFRRCRIYEVKLEAGKSYQIDLMSTIFDSFLDIHNEQGQSLAADDDSGGGLNSRIRFQPPQTATYQLFVGPLGGNETGAFHLRVEELTPPKAQPVRSVPPNGSLTIDAQITAADALHPQRQLRTKIFPIEMKKQMAYEIEATSALMDVLVEGFDDANRTQGFSSSLRVIQRPAKLRITPEKDGVFNVWVSSMNLNETGGFQLVIRDPNAKEPAKQPVQPPMKLDPPANKGAAKATEKLTFDAMRIAKFEGKMPAVQEGVFEPPAVILSVALEQNKQYDLSVQTENGKAIAWVKRPEGGVSYAMASSAISKKTPRRFTVPMTGEYYITVTPTIRNNAGDFTLILRDITDMPPPMKNP
jgi:hypothetical protein